MTKDALGAEYADYNLVVAGPLGMPTEQSTINGALIEENNLPKVVFHSFRHSSITYKLKLNGGDIKAVQGDSGHAQASMVTEQYAHILDDDRRLNAQRFDDFFYQHHGAEPEVLPRAEQSTPHFFANTHRFISRACIHKQRQFSVYGKLPLSVLG